jgi:hypothetical protein
MNDDALLRLQFRMRSLSDPDSQGWRNAFPFAIDPVVSRFGAAPRSTIDIGVSDVSVRNHSLSLRPPPGRRRTRNRPFQIRPQNDLQHAKNTELNRFYGPPLGIDVRPKPRPDHPRLGLWIQPSGWLGHLSITATAVYAALAPNRLKDFWRDRCRQAPWC